MHTLLDPIIILPEGYKDIRPSRERERTRKRNRTSRSVHGYVHGHVYGTIKPMGYTK